MTIGENILKARKKRGLSQAKLAGEIGVSRTAIGQWEGDETIPRHDKVPKLSAVLGLPVSALTPFGVGTVVPVSLARGEHAIVLLDWADLVLVGGDKPMTAAVTALKKQAYLQVSKEISKQSFAFTIADDSMEPEFYRGEVIVIDPDIKPIKGDVVVVRLAKGEHLFREYRERGNGAYDLVAKNGDWETVTVNTKHPGEVLGVMIEHRRKRRR